MIVVKRQLKTYHQAQGLRGKRLKRAVWADVGRAKSARAHQYPWRKSLSPAALDGQFSWGESEQGHAYWSARAGWR